MVGQRMQEEEERTWAKTIRKPDIFKEKRNILQGKESIQDHGDKEQPGNGRHDTEINKQGQERQNFWKAVNDWNTREETDEGIEKEAQEEHFRNQLEGSYERKETKNEQQLNERMARRRSEDRRNTTAINKMKTTKAAEQDNIGNEAWIYGTVTGRKTDQDFERRLEKRKNTGRLKDGNSDTDFQKKETRRKVETTDDKIYAEVLRNRLGSSLEEKEKLEDRQMGFRKNQAQLKRFIL